MNRIVLLIAAVALLPVLLAGYFAWQLLTRSDPPKTADAVAGVEARRVFEPSPTFPPPEPQGASLKPERLEGVEVDTLIDHDRRTRYRIQTGDTLTRIAISHYGDSMYVQDILAANPDIPNENQIRAGQEIILPPPRSERSEKSEDDDRQKIYVVRRGDTLTGIARRVYGDAAMFEKIYDLNRDRLSSPQAILSEGLRLRLPPKPTYD